MTTNNAVNFKQSSNLNTVYVSKNGGSDVTGNGTILYPYATVYHAISTITTATSSTPFKVLLLSGQYQESTNLVLKPFIYIDGSDSDFSTTGTITADTSWNSGGNGIIENFNNFICLSGLNFDFSGASFQGVTFFFKNITSLFLNPSTFTGSGSATRINFIDCNLNTSTTFNNCNFKLQNYTGFNVTANYTSISPIQFFTCYIDNTSLNGTLDITSDGVHTEQIYVTNSPILSGFPGNVSSTGANIGLIMSSDTITDNNIPTLSGGATVQYVNTLPAQNVFGTTSGNDANSGYIGEYFSQSELVGSAQPLSSGVTANVFLSTNLLPPGDWDVYGTVIFNPDTTTTTTEVIAGLSTSSATLPTLGAENNTAKIDTSIPAGKNTVLNVGPIRSSSAFIERVFLVAQATFAVSTMSVYGFMSARRIR